MGATISERLQEYFASKRLSNAQVSRDAGIQYDTLQQILSGKVKAMGVDKFAAIWKVYPDIDAWHILTGEQKSSAPLSSNLTTVEQLLAFKAEMNESLDRRIQELEGE
ncbi:hypothetical protein GCM10028805_25890 [Spirosoma harenae]